jgi:hypothetical protein
MKTRNEDYQEIQNFELGMIASFVNSIDDGEVIPQDLPKRLLVMLLEDEDGEYCNAGGPLTGTPIDLMIIPDIMGKVQRDGNRIVCMMEMVFKEDEMKAVFAFVGEMGEKEEKYTETHTFKINEGEMYIGENGELVYPLSVMELVE